MNTKNFQKYLKKAIFLAKKCDHRALHVSFLVKKNKILASGTNKRRTDTYAYKNGYKFPCTHSELAAIKTLRYRPQDAAGSVLINVRVSRDGMSAMQSRPCPACLALARSVGVARIYFTNAAGEFSLIA